MWWELQRRWMLWGYARRIRKLGWTATYVPGDAETASLSYTTGFQDALGAPEIVMFGVNPEATNDLMWEAHQQLKAGDLVLEDKARWRLDWAEDMPALAWRAVHPSQIRRQHFNLSIWNRERRGLSPEGLKAFQLFVPDPGGKFPWEDGFDTSYRPIQPELYLPFDGPPDDD